MPVSKAAKKANKKILKRVRMNNTWDMLHGRPRGTTNILNPKGINIHNKVEYK